MPRLQNKNENDYQAFLKSAKIPRNNVIDLKKLLLEEEKKAQSRPSSFFEKNQSKLLKFIRAGKKRQKKSNWQINWQGTAVFGAICLFLLIPFGLMAGYQNADQIKGRVMGASVSALENLKSAGTAITQFEINEAKEEFILAEQAFVQAQKELSAMNKVLLFFLKIVPFKGSAISSGEHLIEAGKNISEIGRIISEKIEPIGGANNSDDNSQALGQAIFSLAGSVDEISNKIFAAKKHLEKVNPESLPEEYQEQIKIIKAVLPDLEAYILRLKDIFEVVSDLAGFNGQRDYLFIFQNNVELRPTGGFIGSLALVKTENGELKIIEVPDRGPYEINDDFREKIIPPRPLWLINNEWQIQDANWFADFPASAEKINWFYEKARGYKVDGIISFTPEVIIDLLRLTGPIPLDKYGLTLSADNFVRETQEQVEFEYDEKENKPKEIIADLMPVLLNKTFRLKASELAQLIEILNQSIKKRDILIYSEDNNLQDKILALNWAGEIKSAERDYLMLVSANIGGGKTDSVIDQNLLLTTKIFEDGTVINTLKLTRTHQGNPADIFTKIKNMSYLRFYVPLGSELISAKGFDEIDRNLLLYPLAQAKEDEFLLNIEKNPIIDEKSNTRITEEFGKTCFGNWQGLEVGESREIIVEYKLPFKIKEEKDLYTLYLQKQPGLKPYEVQTLLIASPAWEIIENNSEKERENQELKHKDVLNWDKVYGVILKRK